MKVGVLALQGNYEMHCRVLEKIDIKPVQIRYPNELENVEGLVIPGGESTTMSKLMNRIGLYEEIISFSQNYPILGTCAGLILMSNKIVDSKLKPLGILDISTKRNGYGRQVNSNTIKIEFDLDNKNHSIPASFIRAPKIVEYGQELEVLAKYEEAPVIVKNGKHIAISFHPELDNISILHEFAFKGNQKN